VYARPRSGAIGGASARRRWHPVHGWDIVFAHRRSWICGTRHRRGPDTCTELFRKSRMCAHIERPFRRHGCRARRPGGAAGWRRCRRHARPGGSVRIRCVVTGPFGPSGVRCRRRVRRSPRTSRGTGKVRPTGSATADIPSGGSQVRSVRSASVPISVLTCSNGASAVGCEVGSGARRGRGVRRSDCPGSSGPGGDAAGGGTPGEGLMGMMRMLLSRPDTHSG